jgi:predicted secreted protein
MRFDETASGSEAELSPGEEFEIVLPETRTAGYRWSLNPGAELACPLLEESAQRSPGAAGGSGTRTWRFRAPVAGTCTVEFLYRRSWEDRPARTFTLKIRVRPAP